MWSGIVSVVKKILFVGAQAVPSILGAYNPALGVMVSSILTSVVQAEASLGEKKGLEKKDLALFGLQAAMPAIEMLLVKAGKPVKNPALFAAGVEKVMDGVVDLLNATGENAKAASES